MEDVLLQSGTDKFPQAVSRDGKYLIYAVRGRQNDLWVLSISDLLPAAFIAAEANESFGQFSPDGRWLAYQSIDERGTIEVYVTQFPSGKGKWKVSSQGGMLPRWRGGRFFISAATTTPYMRRT